jgi:hypothetical protein
VSLGSLVDIPGAARRLEALAQEPDAFSHAASKDERVTHAVEQGCLVRAAVAVELPMKG